MKVFRIFATTLLMLILMNICTLDVRAQMLTTDAGLQAGAGLQTGAEYYGGGVLSNQVVSPVCEPLECTVIDYNASRIYIGDSRTYIMHTVVGDDGASWLGFSGSRYGTFSTRAASYVDGIPLAGKQIVIMYGINDIMSYGAQQTFDNYNYFLNGKAQEWISRGAKVYFVSLVGVSKDLVIAGFKADPREITAINNQVAAFNTLMAGFPANIYRININPGANPFLDGIHYDVEACQSIYQQINNCL